MKIVKFGPFIIYINSNIVIYNNTYVIHKYKFKIIYFRLIICRVFTILKSINN